MKDWSGDTNSVFKTLGASNHTDEERANNDYYATDPKALELLLEREKFFPYVWECACGEGHLSEVLKAHGYKVKSSDIVDRGYHDTKIIDFLKVQKSDIDPDYSRDIITNPPYKYAKEFVEKALEISIETTKIAMLLKLTFLEGQARKKLFETFPPKKIYVFSKRIECGKNGVFTGTSAVAYAWFIWEKGYSGKPFIEGWID